MSKDKQARRASDAQKIALEKQLVKEGKIFPAPVTCRAALPGACLRSFSRS